jgi:hypothetical protein
MDDRAGDTQRWVRATDLPTPFSAEEIRAASPNGHTVETVTEEFGTVTARRRTTFLDVDAAGANMRVVALDIAGAEVGDAESHRAAWTDLQAHASFPADQTTRVREQVDTPLGLLDALRYEVRRGEEQMTFWFALEHPGMPILMAVARDGELVSMTTVTSIRTT